jgi:hypothetical protein
MKRGGRRKMSWWARVKDERGHEKGEEEEKEYVGVGGRMRRGRDTEERRKKLTKKLIKMREG